MSVRVGPTDLSRRARPRTPTLTQCSHPPSVIGSRDEPRGHRHRHRRDRPGSAARRRTRNQSHRLARDAGRCRAAVRSSAQPIRKNEITTATFENTNAPSAAGQPGTAQRPTGSSGDGMPRRVGVEVLSALPGRSEAQSKRPIVRRNIATELMSVVARGRTELNGRPRSPSPATAPTYATRCSETARAPAAGRGARHASLTKLNPEESWEPLSRFIGLVHPTEAVFLGHHHAHRRATRGGDRLSA